MNKTMRAGLYAIILTFLALPLSAQAKNPPLITALSKGNLGQVRALLKKGADPNESGEYGVKPADVAAAAPRNRVAMLKLLGEKGADFSAKAGANILGSARNLDVIHYLVDDKGLDINAKDRFGSKLAEGYIGYTQAKSMDLAFLEGIKKKGYDLSPETHENLVKKFVTNLAYKGTERDTKKTISILRFLEKEGYDLKHTKMSMGRTWPTLIHVAGADEKAHFIAPLVKLGSDVNSDLAGFTALHQAARRGQPKAAAELIRLGADVNAIDNNGYSPLIGAVLSDYRESNVRPGMLARHRTMYDVKGVIKLLVKKGADRKKKFRFTRNGETKEMTALELARANGEKDMVRLLQ